MKNILSWLVFGLTVCVMPQVHAHFVWVMRSGDSVYVRFSESAESTEPELLKNVAAAKVWARIPGGRSKATMQESPLSLAADSLSAKLDPKADVVVASHDYGVVNKGGATFLLKYLAKQSLSDLPGQWTAVNDPEKMPLEIVPSWKDRSIVLTVTLSGKPVEGLEVSVAGCGLSETLTTDSQGSVLCQPTENGVMSVRAKHVLEQSGELDGRKYDSVRTYSTLTLPISIPSVSPVTHQLPALPQGITSFGAAIAGDSIYVYGGQFGEAHHYSESGQSGDFLRIAMNAEKPQWEQLEGGPKLTGLALVEYNGKLYRIGGFTAKNSEDQDQSLWSQSDFARFDPSTGHWEQLPAMPSGRSSHDAAVMDGKLYVVGGWNMQGADSTTWHTTALVCDLNNPELKWEELPTPPFQRRAVSLAAFDGRIFVMGGMTEADSTTTEVGVFDPASGTWSAAPTLLGNGMEGFGTSAFAAGDQLVVTTMSGAVQSLSKGATTWTVAGTAVEPRFFHRQLTTSSGDILLVGGASMQTGKTNTVELLRPSSTTR